ARSAQPVDREGVDSRNAKRPLRVGGRRRVEHVDVALLFSIISTMFSNIANSSNAGFIVADSTKSSALVGMSANFRNHWIFSRISRFERSIVSRVSIS